MTDLKFDLDKLLKQERFTDEEIVFLLGLEEESAVNKLKKASYELTTKLVGNEVYYRGLIELSNVCTLNCRYCGIRKGNHDLTRYEMSAQEVIEQAVWATENGYGNICLQAGERQDEKFINFVADLLEKIHALTVSPKLPNGLGITLSLGYQSKETLAKWAQASGNKGNLRYLARFETSNEKLFDFLHEGKGKKQKELVHRLEFLKMLRETGYQVGTGVMIGIPGQTPEDLCADIRTFQAYDVDMIGMGPYLMSDGGELGHIGQLENKKLFQLSLNMIAVTRLVLRNVNIAAATALQVLDPEGREKGIEYGCNVVMPNLSPQRYRKGYQLYDHKPGLSDEPSYCGRIMEKKIESKGRVVAWNKHGSSKKWLERQGKLPA